MCDWMCVDVRGQQKIIFDVIGALMCVDVLIDVIVGRAKFGIVHLWLSVVRLSIAQHCASSARLR